MLGVVLAGGESRRMGADKLDLIVAGEPLWRRQAGVLRAAGADPVVLMRRPGQPAPEGIACWRDVAPQAGPLGGLHAALARGVAPWVAVLAVDMPGIDAAWFRWLQGFCTGEAGAMARQADDYEPLAAIYPAAAIGEVEARIARGELSVQALARALESSGRLRLVPIPPERAQQAANLNTPGDWQAWPGAERR